MDSYENNRIQPAVSNQAEEIEERNATLTRLVQQIFNIEEIRWAEAKEKHLVRYRGRLRMDSEQAYEQLQGALKSLGVTPVFREEENSQVIILLPGVVDSRPSNPWVNLVLFILTVFSVIFAGVLYAYDGPINPDDPWMTLLQNWTAGVPFAVSLLAILLAHEFGHYLAGRYHKTNVTLPYFIPFPLSLFGTMGAFIQLKEPPRNKKVLLDIGISGPLAGLVVAIPVLIIGLLLSEIGQLPATLGPQESFSLEGNSLLYLGLKYLVFGELLPAPVSYEGLSPVLYWLQYIVTGMPLPLGGRDVLLHPVAWAGWAGLLVTALNLIPAGQLDGGHVLYVLLGKRARFAVPVILLLLLPLGLVWNGWWLWAGLIFFLGRVHAEPLDQITQLDGRRRALAWFGLIVAILVFIPVPLILI